MLQDLWKEREELTTRYTQLGAIITEHYDAGDKAAVLAAEEEFNDALGKAYGDTDCAIADIVPQTLEECLIHARLLATAYCTEEESNWSDKQDALLAKSLLAGLERLAERAES